MIAFLGSMLLAATNPVVAATAASLSATKKSALPDSSATLSPEILKTLSGFQFTHKTMFQQNWPWLTHTLAALFMICAVGLVLLLAVQTTKQEGLSGTIGGRVESAYRPRLGFDQQLQRLTGYVAIGMVFLACILSLTGI